MKKIVSLTLASLVVAALLPSAARAQMSEPTTSPASPTSPTSPTAPGATPDGTTAPSTAPVAPSESSPSTTTAPAAGAKGLCAAPISSTGTSGTGTASSTTSSTSSTTTTTGTTNSSTSTTETRIASTSTTPSSAAPSEPIASRILNASSDQVEYNNLVGPSHYIKLAVGNSPLCYVSVSPLQDVEATDSIKVLDGSGNIINANVTKQDDGSAKISFEQPLAAGSTLTLALQGVEYYSSLNPTTVQYSLAGGFADYSQEIPYGIAQVQRFRR
ncbi:hypothetical protein [Altericista sp. CCNU0014]|uniref:hypothetical protein n=1 Tax=Altericista sp. CCNU0014 TaxID=3082949 RepID=UPI00384EFFBC